MLETAARIGAVLCRSAYWHDGRCNWIGRSSREAASPATPIVPTTTALGPDVYGGTAGIAIFLAELYDRTGSGQAARTARGAIHHALHQAERHREAVVSFYSGWIGIAYAAMRVGLRLDDSTLAAEALQLARRALATDRGTMLDVVGGAAGAIAPLFWLARMPGGQTLEMSATELADDLAKAAIKEGGVWRWDVERASGKGMGTVPLCGFAHGASGMGLALIEAGARCGRRDWIEGGLAAFDYEDQLYDADQKNWPDLREFPFRSPKSISPSRSFMIAWCHGAVGIGLARLRAYGLLPSSRVPLMSHIRHAIDATVDRLATLPRHADASPCHGRAGLTELLVAAACALEDPHYCEIAESSWAGVIRPRAAADWPCGVASGRNNPSLMLGYAGVGYELLRIDNPRRTPSLLVVAPTGTVASEK